MLDAASFPSPVLVRPHSCACWSSAGSGGSAKCLASYLPATQERQSAEQALRITQAVFGAPGSMVASVATTLEGAEPVANTQPS